MDRGVGEGRKLTVRSRAAADVDDGPVYSTGCLVVVLTLVVAVLVLPALLWTLAILLGQ